MHDGYFFCWQGPEEKEAQFLKIQGLFKSLENGDLSQKEEWKMWFDEVYWPFFGCSLLKSDILCIV